MMCLQANWVKDLSACAI